MHTNQLVNLGGRLCHVDTLEDQKLSQSDLMQLYFVEVLILILTVLVLLRLYPFLLDRDHSVIIILTPATKIV